MTYKNGFTLVEIAVVILILGLLTAMIMRVMEPVLQSYQMDITDRHMEKVKDALENYVLDNDAYPCPAEMNLAKSDSGYGEATDCASPPPPGVEETLTGRDGEAVRIGAIPVKTLNIPFKYIADGWGNKFTFAVSVPLTNDMSFDNDSGAIFIEDADNNSVTSIPGNAHYVILSHGPNGAGAFTKFGQSSSNECLVGEVEGENCDNDAVFISSSRRSGLQLYDDVIHYQSFVGSLNQPRCGNRGMLYAPAHPDSDSEDCLDPSYRRVDTVDIDTAFGVNCTTPFAVCRSGWQDVKTIGDPLPAGDYLVHWSGFLQFNYPQESQYGTIEIEVGSDDYNSRKVVFNSATCANSGPVQSESGLIDFSLDSPDPVRVRIAFYGGDYVTDACGAGNEPRLQAVPRGVGTGATKSLSFDFYRKPQTF